MFSYWKGGAYVSLQTSQSAQQELMSSGWMLPFNINIFGQEINPQCFPLEWNQPLGENSTHTNPYLYIMHKVTLTGHSQMVEVRGELMLHNQIQSLPCLIDEQTRSGNCTAPTEAACLSVAWAENMRKGQGPNENRKGHICGCCVESLALSLRA